MRRSKPYVEIEVTDLYVFKIQCPDCLAERIYRFKHDLEDYITCKCCKSKFMMGYDGEEEWDYDSIKKGYEVIVDFEDMEDVRLRSREEHSEYYEREQYLGVSGREGTVIDMGMEQFGHYKTALVDFGDINVWVDCRDLKINRVKNENKWY